MAVVVAAVVVVVVVVVVVAVVGSVPLLPPWLNKNVNSHNNNTHRESQETWRVKYE